GTDYFQTGRMHEVHLGILRMKRTTMDVTTAGSANDERCGRSPAVVGLRHHVYDLVEGAADEIHELKFGDRTHAGERCSEGSPNNRGFCDRRVNDALGTEAVNEAVRYLESA